MDAGPLQTLDVQADRFRAEVFYEMAGARRAGAIVTDWGVECPSKEVTIHFDSGATLVLDHQRASGRLVDPAGQNHDEFTYEARIPRLVAHYRSLFASLFVRGGTFRTALQDDLIRLLVRAIPRTINPERR